MADESVWLEQAVRGDREAFDALIRPRWARMVRLAARVVGDEGDAQDVAQEAVLRVWRTLDRFRPGEVLDAWIHRIVVNLAVDCLRRRRARPESRSAGVAAELPLRDPAAGPEANLFARELEDALQEVTRDLPARQKAVFVLARIDGLPTAQIAEILGVTESTVRNTLFQARAAIARGLRERRPKLLGEPEDIP
jgi:RNA polymerase sigma-70 factor (ECF subfamily)